MAKRRSKKRLKINRQEAIEHERRAWQLRSRGWSQGRIADEMGLSQPAISKILKRVETRELKRLSGSVERLKVVQNSQLEHVIEEAAEAWGRSKTPRKRASRRTGGGDGAGEHTVNEVIERDGDPAYLYVVMNAHSNQRSLWGLDVAPALQEPMTSIAELARDLLGRGAEYEKRAAAENSAGNSGQSGGADPPGNIEMPKGSEPLQ